MQVTTVIMNIAQTKMTVRNTEDTLWAGVYMNPIKKTSKDHIIYIERETDMCVCAYCTHACIIQKVRSDNEAGKCRGAPSAVVDSDN